MFTQKIHLIFSVIIKLYFKKFIVFQKNKVYLACWQ